MYNIVHILLVFTLTTRRLGFCPVYTFNGIVSGVNLPLFFHSNAPPGFLILNLKVVFTLSVLLNHNARMPRRYYIIIAW